MLDRVIDAPAHQGRTDLEQALAQAVWEQKRALPLFLGLCNPAKLCLLGNRCLQSIEGCGLLASSQSCSSINQSGIRRDCAEPLGLCLFQGASWMHAQLVIW